MCVCCVYLLCGRTWSQEGIVDPFVRSSSLSFSPPVPFRPYVSLTLSLPAPVPWGVRGDGGVVDVYEWSFAVCETAFVVLCVFPVFLTAVSRQ